MTFYGDEKHIADVGSRAFFEMVLVHNFVHADLHPGNILVQRWPSHRADHENHVVGPGEVADRLVGARRHGGWYGFERVFRVLSFCNSNEFVWSYSMGAFFGFFRRALIVFNDC